MTKSKLYSKNSAKRGLLLSTFLTILFILGCSSSTQPSFLQKDIPAAVRDICKKEFDINLTTKLTGKTLWVFMPAEDIFEKIEKPEKTIERFQLDKDDCSFEDDTLKLEYLIKLITPETEKLQDVGLSKKVSVKTNQAWSVIRRVLFSMDRSKAAEPDFICFVLGDIKNGVEIRQVSYYLDLKKVSYNYISMDEYQHRTTQDINMVSELINDQKGAYIDYHDVTLKEFIAKQVQYRIRLKFQKPEIEKNSNIDKEIEKAVATTIKIYGMKDFDGVELNNLATSSKLILNAAAIWDRITQ